MQGTGDAAMPMESLLALGESLRVRIDSHGDALRRSEMMTRYALIDPLLRELGWDTSDPAVVIPEYSSGSGRADYALLDSGTPVTMVEAKKLDEPLQGAVSQGIQYCLEWGTRNFAVTDGRRWEIYETHRPVPINDKRIVAFDLKGSSTAEVCLQALALWRSGVVEGQVRPGQIPVVGLPTDQPSTDEPCVVEPPPTEPGWEPLTTLNPGPSSRPPAPIEILFPDNSPADIKHWVGVTESVVRWLMGKGLLTEAHCPIRQGNLHLLATRPTHPNGNAMREKRIDSLYLNRDYNSRDQVRNSINIIRHVGQDPSQFRVRFGE